MCANCLGVGEPLRPEVIAAGVGLPVERVQALLDDLEAGMTFLYRNPAGAVHWAYPVTADETPHLGHVFYGRADPRRLSDRRDCDALRARATAG